MRQHRTVGSLLRVPLLDGTHTYAQVLHGADCVFFDARATTDLEPDDILKRPALFRVAVYNHAITKGRWIKVGKAPVSAAMAAPQPTFIQDSLDPSRFEIYLGGVITPAQREQCVGLECCAVWEPEHVEERLRDHYAGRANKWVTSLQIEGPPNPSLQRTRYARR